MFQAQADDAASSNRSSAEDSDSESSDASTIENDPETLRAIHAQMQMGAALGQHDDGQDDRAEPQLKPTDDLVQLHYGQNDTGVDYDLGREDFAGIDDEAQAPEDREGHQRQESEVKIEDQ